MVSRNRIRSIDIAVVRWGEYHIERKYREKGTELIISDAEGLLTMTLSNISSLDGGEYFIRWATENKIGIGDQCTLFVWGQSAPPRLASNGTHVTCDVISTSVPEDSRPNMIYTFRINDKAEAKQLESVFGIPQSDPGSVTTIACQGKENGSELTSWWSEQIFVPNLCKYLHEVSIYVVGYTCMELVIL